jgi:hypothetical protein
MAIETRRNGKQYYYRKKRIGGHVVSQYLGTGYSAHLMQRLDEHERQEAQEKREAWQAIVDAESELDAQLDEVTEVVSAYTGAALLVSGYHQHKRQWRKQK